jgi:CRP-like cAMP-binding protein
MTSNAILDRVFTTLKAEERDDLFEKAGRLTFGLGDVIIKEGAKIESFYIVAKGEVRVTRNVDGTENAEFVGPRGPGEPLGEMSFIDGLGASATLIADGDVEIFAIPGPAISKMMEAESTFAGRFYHSVLLTMSRRLRDTNARVLPPST